MASTVLPNGIIIPEKYSRDWYADLYHNWEELDNLLGGGGANDGTLTIQKNGTTVGTFSANQATDETIDISVPDVNNGTLTIQQNGTNVQTFTANASTNATANIQCVDLSTAQTIAGDKDFTGTTGTHDVIPATTDTYDLGSSAKEYNNAYIKSLTINGVAAGDILTHNASEFFPVSGSNAITGTGFFKSTSDGQLQIGSGTSTITGGCLVMYGSEYSNTDVAGAFRLRASNTSVYDLVGKVNGTLTWGTKNVAMQEDVNTLLSNKANSSHTHTKSDITDFPSLATVATSGSYNDLSNKPTIPAVNNATLTIQKNGTDIGTFSANQTTNETVNIEVPDALPIGSYIQFAGSQAPAGFLVCNGGEISRTTYSALFAVIGTTYGSGDGSTTFNLPNLTDRFLQGSTTSGTVKNAGLPSITGGVRIHGAGTGTNVQHVFGSLVGVTTRNTYYGGAQSPGANSYDGFDLNASRSSSIYGNSATVQPPALTCLICIKY